MSHMQEKQEKVDNRKARPYQVEIVLNALQQNSIVCLGTGTGKTFISASVIKELQGSIKGTHAQDGKRTFFLVNTVPLVEQQAEEIKKVTCLHVGCYTGDKGVDFWDKTRWIKEFDENDVLVMTAQILVNILTSAFIGFHNINLLVLDECHNASKKHPYVSVLEFHDKCPERDYPRILGLTASVINEKYKGSEFGIREFLQRKMKSLEAIMRSVCITCTDPDATSAFATKPEEIIESYSSDIDTNGYEQVVLMNADLREKLKEGEDNFKKEYKLHKNTPKSNFDGLNHSGSYNLLLFGVLEVKKANAYLIASDAAKYCGDILEELGPLCGYEAAKLLLKQIAKHQAKQLASQSQKVFHEVTSLLRTVVSTFELYIERSPFHHVDNVILTEPFITKKAYTFLSKILYAQQVNFKKHFDVDLHAIVFVERRCTAVILSKLINYQAKADPDTFGGLKSQYVLGHGLDGNIHLADSLMKSSTQNQILAGFKRGDYNVLVATSIIEEGLDVRKCNLVVRFNGIGNFRQYAQSKGRARSKNSKFIVMNAEKDINKTRVDLKMMQEIERILYEKCRSVRRNPTGEEIENAMEDEEKEYIPTYYVDDGPDPARITRNSCVSLLYRFCNKLIPSDEHYSSNPRFEYETRGKFDDHEVRCKVLLPAVFPLEEKIYTGDWMPRDDLAKKNVSMLICILLHTKGELDDHLLQITSDDEEEDKEEERKEEKRAEVETIYPRKIPTALSQQDVKDERWNLYAISMVLSEPRDNPNAWALWPLWFNERKGFGILLPCYIPLDLPEIKLYTRAGGLRVHLKLICSDVAIPDNAVEYHQYIIQMCSEKYVNVEMDFDFNHPKVSKGILVPLLARVFSEIDTQGLYKSAESLIDFNALESFQHNGNLIIKNSVIHKTYLDDAQNERLYYVTGLSLEKAGDIMDGTETYTQYYSRKYLRSIDPSSRLLEVLPISSKVNFTENTSTNEFNKTTRVVERLVPALCRKMFNIDAFIHQQMILIPYILYAYECILNAHELRHDISVKIDISYDNVQDNKMEVDSNHTVTSSLEHVLRLSSEINEKTKCPSVSDVLEGITTRQARFPFDLERLEMLGDSFLKQATTIYLYFRYPSEQEGELTPKRMRCIRNQNLFRIANEIGIQNIICNSQFGNVNPNNMNSNSVTVWLPPGYLRSPHIDNEGDMEVAYQLVKGKSLADCVEALIGVYFKTGGTNLALKFMQEFLHLKVLFSAIPEDERASMKINGTHSFYADFPIANTAISNPLATYKDVQKLYEEWKFSRLEKQIGYKFRDKSYLLQAMRHLSYDLSTVTGCYQRLEFLGDAVLDFLVTLHVFTNKRSLTPGELTSIRSALVNNNTFALLVVKNKFDTHIKHLSPVFDGNLKEFKSVTGFGEDEDSFNACFKNPFVIVPKNSNEGYHAPKILGDIFEAITGAVFLDCHMDLVKVWKVIYPLMKDITDKYMEEIPLNPVREFIETYPNAKWTYEESDGDTVCTAHFGEGCTAIGIGKNKKMAKATASWKAVHRE